MKTNTDKKAALNGDVNVQIGQLTDKTVEMINVRTAESWIKIGEQVSTYDKTMKAKFGDTKDWFVELAEHPDSIHKSTMLRTYAAGWVTWQKLSEETRGAMNKKGIKVTHMALVLSSRYTQEDRDIHLKHAAEKGMSVSQFKAYLKEEEKKGAFVDDGGSGLIPALSSPTTIPFDWSQSVTNLQSSLSKSFSNLVGLKGKLGDREMPSEISKAITNLVRFAVTQGIVSKEDIREFMDIQSNRIEFIKGSGKQ
jgi:hypothetical protein